MKEKLPNLTEEDITENCSEQSFEKGEDYYYRGAIVHPMIYGMTLRAECEGSQFDNYIVTVSLAEDGIADAYCTCSYDWGGYCKHIVALLLTWINTPDKFLVVDDLLESLKEKDKDELVGLIGRMIEREPSFISLIESGVDQLPRQTPLERGSYQRQIEYAFSQGIDYYHVNLVSEKLNNIINTARGFEEKGDYRSAVLILMELLEGCDEYIGEVDDSDGMIGSIAAECVDRLHEDFPKADFETPQRQGYLKELFSLYVNNDYGIGDELDQLILSVYQEEDAKMLEELAKEELERLSSSRESGYYYLYRASELVNFLLEFYGKEGRVEDFITLCEQEDRHLELSLKLLELGKMEEALEYARTHLREANDYLRLADMLDRLGKKDEAIALCEEWIDSSEGYKDHLLEKLAELYEEKGELERSLDLQLRRFQQRGSLDLYLKIRELAEELGDWMKLEGEIVSQLEEEKHYILLINIYLEERELDKAWQTLRFVESPSEYLLRDVADSLRKTYPHRAIGLYQRIATSYINRVNRRAYRQAVECLRKVKELYEEMEEEDRWNKYISDLRAKNSKRPALLDELSVLG